MTQRGVGLGSATRYVIVADLSLICETLDNESIKPCHGN